MYLVDTSLELLSDILQLISSKPKAARRGSSRRGAARAQVLGKPGPSPAQRARVTAPAAEAKTIPQASEKIIVSNLPTDVNEAQIKVSCLLKRADERWLTFSVGTVQHHRWTCSRHHPQLRRRWSLQRHCHRQFPEERRWKQGIPAVQQSPYRWQLVSLLLSL